MAKKTNSKKNNSFVEDDFKIGDELGFLSNEAYKRLRTNLIYSFAGSEKCKILGLTSTLSGEGKTTTSLNLAHSIAQTGKLVLIIECDLRKPKFSQRLSMKRSPGLADLLVGEINNLQEIIQNYEKGCIFDVIVAGNIPPNPSELLGSTRMEKILQVSSTIYDYIILDLPPVTAVADPLVVAKNLDGMVVVVRHNYTDKHLLKSTLRQIDGTGVKILGFVYNGATNFGKKYGKNYATKYGLKNS